MYRASMKVSRGITLIELLIVIAIIALLLIVLFGLFLPQLGRSRDAHRRTDLERLKVTFEDYYNDRGCYPPPEILENCDGSQLQPYLNRIPCDPLTNSPYLYLPAEEDNYCAGYRLLASMEDTHHPSVAELGCDGACGCGWGPDYVYGVSSGIPVPQTACTPVTPLISPSPLPSPGSGNGPPATPPPSVIYVYACDAGGICNQYEEGHPFLSNCPITFPTSVECQAECVGHPEYRCN